jgi:HD-GYP domain-containing protein (c-di-GMP phosphodiesterase class II)
MTGIIIKHDDDIILEVEKVNKNTESIDSEISYAEKLQLNMERYQSEINEALKHNQVDKAQSIFGEISKDIENVYNAHMHDKEKMKKYEENEDKMNGQIEECAHKVNILMNTTDYTIFELNKDFIEDFNDQNQEINDIEITKIADGNSINKQSFSEEILPCIIDQLKKMLITGDTRIDSSVTVNEHNIFSCKLFYNEIEKTFTILIRIIDTNIDFQVIDNFSKNRTVRQPHQLDWLELEKKNPFLQAVLESLSQNEYVFLVEDIRDVNHQDNENDQRCLATHCLNERGEEFQTRLSNIFENYTTEDILRKMDENNQKIIFETTFEDLSYKVSLSSYPNKVGCYIMIIENITDLKIREHKIHTMMQFYQLHQEIVAKGMRDIIHKNIKGVSDLDGLVTKELSKNHFHGMVDIETHNLLITNNEDISFEFLDIWNNMNIYEFLVGEKDLYEHILLDYVNEKDIEAETCKCFDHGNSYEKYVLYRHPVTDEIHYFLCFLSPIQEKLGVTGSIFVQISDQTKIFEADYKQQKSFLDTLMQFHISHDEETAQHITRTGKLARTLAEATGKFLEYELIKIEDEVPLHDIGKVVTPDEILKKPGKLSTEELKIMKKHAEIGEKILKYSSLKFGATIAGGHHENWDGSGYPKGVKGDKIPLIAQITSIVDVFDALANDRCYKIAFTREEVIEEMQRISGTKFNPKLVDLVLNGEYQGKKVIDSFYKIEKEYPNKGQYEGKKILDLFYEKEYPNKDQYGEYERRKILDLFYKIKKEHPNKEQYEGKNILDLFYEIEEKRPGKDQYGEYERKRILDLFYKIKEKYPNKDQNEEYEGKNILDLFYEIEEKYPNKDQN